MNKEIEYRKIDSKLTVSDSRKIEGYAICWNVLSEDLGGFREQIDPNALDGVIEKSDVFALLNHDKTRGILARSKKGKGSLSLVIDEKGLKYSFDAPMTDLGNEAIEYLKRGEIDSSSFAFTVEKDEWVKQNDGTYIRTILKFGQLMDASLVFNPAYTQTSVTYKRFLEIKEQMENIEQVEEVREIEEVKEVVENIEVIEEVEQIDNIEEVTLVETQDENVTDEPTEIVEVESEQRSIEIKIDNEQLSENNNKNKEKRKMENFKLVSVINKIAEKRGLSEFEQEVLNAGKAEFRKSGLSASGEIQLPMESRSDITATGSGTGIENVPETKMNILEPLRANLVLAQAGAQVMTGLVGDVSIPTYAASTVAWKGENVSATDGAGAFGEVTLKPKRLTAYINISKQFLLQDSNDAEAMLNRDIMNAISDKLESTILGNVSGSTTQPVGVFYGVTGTSTASYSGITAVEESLETKNVKQYSFIVNPKAKSALKAAKVNEGKMVFADGQIDGVATYTTSNVYSKGIVVADWRDLVIGVWGIELTVDPYTLAGDGKVKLVINAYVDAAFRRDSYSTINLA